MTIGLGLLARTGFGSRPMTIMTRASLYGPLSPKRGNKEFYKGTGAVKGGRHTKKGKYIIDPRKQKHIMMPELTGFQLKPYVSMETPLPKGKRLRESRRRLPA